MDFLSQNLNVAAEQAVTDTEQRRRDERQWAQGALDFVTELLDELQEIEECTAYVVLVPVSTRFGRRVRLAAFPSGALIQEGPSRYGYFLTCTGSLVHAFTGHRVDHRLVHPQMVLGLIDLIEAAPAEENLGPIAEHLRLTWAEGVSPVLPGA